MIGQSKKGTLASFLERRRVPMVVGFDPRFQVMHEEAGARAIALAAVASTDGDLKGVFNVAGPPPLPLSSVVKLAGRTSLPLLEVALPLVFGRFGLPRLPAQSIEHLKHAVVVDDAAFRAATGFTHSWDEAETLTSFRS